MKSIFASAVLFAGMAFTALAQTQDAPQCKIPTAWAEQVSQTAPHPEYPRPQMIRSNWQSLNGKWDYAITASGAAMPENPDGKILVPFAPESSLSGVGKLLEADQVLWYSRTFTIPKGWAGKRVMLNFDAVDWQAEVFVNDVLVGIHTGGYTAFSFDITPYLSPKGEQSLRVKVKDATDKSFQARGKQVSRQEGIWYTRVSGIWQSVWMEPVSDGSIESYYVTSDVAQKTISVETSLLRGKEGDIIVAELLEGSEGYSTEEPSEKVINTLKAAAGTRICFDVQDLKTWSPNSPYIYGLRLSLVRSGKVIDKVDGYAIARNIGICRDSRSHKRMTLNGEPLFHMGPLDQGWWPDGLYTAPTDEALAYDIIKTKNFGFNMIRKHIKIEPARWYWYCDRIGIMVWQDMPAITDSGKNRWGTGGFNQGTDYPVPQEWKDNYYKEWSEMIGQRKFFQCIVVWVPFNEAWGQFDTEKTVEFTKNLDPTRLVNSASGGNFHHCGDIIDIHHYPDPELTFYDSDYVMVLGEYGGIGLPLEGHLWQPDRNWGYVQFKSSNEVTDTYELYAEKLKELVAAGFSAAVYTQTTDVEGEVNGVMTYDRKVVKMNESRLKAINESIISSMK